MCHLCHFTRHYSWPPTNVRRELELKARNLAVERLQREIDALSADYTARREALETRLAELRVAQEAE